MCCFFLIKTLVDYEYDSDDDDENDETSEEVVSYPSQTLLKTNVDQQLANNTESKNLLTVTSNANTCETSNKNTAEQMTVEHEDDESKEPLPKRAATEANSILAAKINSTAESLAESAADCSKNDTNETNTSLSSSDSLNHKNDLRAENSAHHHHHHHHHNNNHNHNHVHHHNNKNNNNNHHHHLNNHVNSNNNHVNDVVESVESLEVRVTVISDEQSVLVEKSAAEMQTLTYKIKANRIKGDELVSEGAAEAHHMEDDLAEDRENDLISSSTDAAAAAAAVASLSPIGSLEPANKRARLSNS